VVESNVVLGDKPALVNDDPYGKGWMIVIEARDASEAEDLLDASAYRELTLKQSGDES
jgi:glycine cleavage system H protein